MYASEVATETYEHIFFLFSGGGGGGVAGGGKGGTHFFKLDLDYEQLVCSPITM